MANVFIKEAVSLIIVLLLMVKIVGNKKPSLLIEPLLTAMQSFATNLSNDESYSPPPDIGFSFAMCHLPLLQKADGFQLLADSGSSKQLTC